MKLYPRLPTAVSALAFSPDGSKLAIGASFEHDNALSAADDQAKVMLLIKDTVMDDCRVRLSAFVISLTVPAQGRQGIKCSKACMT